MAIGITTIVGDNYGSALQAMALQQAFKNCGSEATIIRLRPKSYILQFLRNYILPDKNNKIAKKLAKAKSDWLNRLKRKKVRGFYSKYVSTTTYRNIKQLEQNLYKTYVLVCGSDQVWNPAYLSYRLYYWEFNVPQNTKMYSYAASLAVDELTQNEQRAYVRKLEKFCKLSVREATGKRLLESCLKREDIRVDVDPVMLMEPEYWNHFVSERFNNKKYILVYMLRPMPELISYAEKIGNELGLEVIYIGDYQIHSNQITCIHDAGVEDFLGGIKHASLILTNSFHATVFSTIFHKPFYSFAISRTGSRVKDFLEKMDLQDRAMDFTRPAAKFSDITNWEEVDAKMEKARKDSLTYIVEISEEERNVSKDF